MNYADFERRAQEIFAGIPPDLRGGVEFLVVSRRRVPHPELPEVYTLGECATGELDLGMDLPDAMRSAVHLYHGSFRAVAALDSDFDWETELEETLLHEIRHHRESTAGEDALEDFDYAADENFKRREGLPFDPLFYRSGEPVDAGAWEVDGDLFVEPPPEAVRGAGDELRVMVAGVEVVLPRPDDAGDVSFLYLDEFAEGPGEVAVVLVRPRGAWAALRGIFRRPDPQVVEWSLEPGDWWVEEDERAGDGEPVPG